MYTISIHCIPVNAVVGSRKSVGLESSSSTYDSVRSADFERYFKSSRMIHLQLIARVIVVVAQTASNGDHHGMLISIEIRISLTNLVF